jgi:hypothetical protein
MSTTRVAQRSAPQGSPVQVKGPFATEWTPLAAEGEDENVRATALAAASGLRDELGAVVNAESLVVLAGLGTSRGILDADGTSVAPTMGHLWAAIQELGSFEAVKPQLDQELLSGGNLEHILSDVQARVAVARNDEQLSTFLSEAEALVLERCSFVKSNTAVDRHELFLRKVARRSTRLQRTQLFTTNYDRAFELAAVNTRFHVIDGFGLTGSVFDGGSFDLDFVRRRPNEQLTLEPNVFHLLKLHGSVDWDQSSGNIRKTSRRNPEEPVLIYPSAAKYQLSFQQPYLEFMSRFQIALRQQDVGLIVVGFGFNDAHIVAPIEAALKSNIGLRLVVVAPELGTDAQSSTAAWIENLIAHGDRRLTLLRGTFDDLARELPDVPELEEREAHTRRVSRPRPEDSR